MKNILIFALFLSLAIMNNCTPPTSSKLPQSPLQDKIDMATLSMYKIYSKCVTSILLKTDSQIDTLQKNVSYLCLSANVFDVENKSDTVIVTVFFEPEHGFLMEDANCEFAYSLGFIGEDNQWDFIMFGDSGDKLSSKIYLSQNTMIDSIFNAKLKSVGCINPKLQALLAGVK